MILRLLFLYSLVWLNFIELRAQCGSPIAAFPYQEGFEITDGGWMPGGTGSDWAWGPPAKTVIAGAGSGLKCWIVGGLTGSSYTNAEASWLQSPCFNFSALQYPYITFRVFWEMEQQFDGGSLQYSTDNGSTWTLVGSASDPANCINSNWFNFSPITYLAPLTAVREGWSGNIQSSSGSCRGGSGSNGWVSAKHSMPYLAGRASVLFRFIFGAGTICNNYDGFAVDDIRIGEAPANAAAFSYTCLNSTTVDFVNQSPLCPSGFSWDFDDPASGTNNVSTNVNPQHVFSSPGTYSVSFTVSGPGNAPSTITKDITILGLTPQVLSPADCLGGSGGSATVAVTGGPGPYSYSWNTSPSQTGPVAINLGPFMYSVSVNATNACPASASLAIPIDLSCVGIYFPAAFTPNQDGRNDLFGPLGSLTTLGDYSLSIYNRWGELVFHSTNPFEKWNGRVKGKNTDSNIFVWYSEFSIQGQPKQSRKGTIMLIR